MLVNRHIPWLEEDAAWIITQEEREAFQSLSNDEQRDDFIEAFWRRRDHFPDTAEDEYKEEHYQRITYANEHFGAGIPGWKSDRGRVYIMLGEPDEIENHAAGEKQDQSQNATVVPSVAYPREIWRYRDLDGINQNIVLEFVDICRCGEYPLTLDPSGPEALSRIQDYLRKALSSTGGPEAHGAVLRPQSGSPIPRPFKFPELAAALEKVNINPLPFYVRADFVRATGATTVVPITLQVKNQDLVYVTENGVDRAVVNIFGRVLTLTGRVVETFEDTLNVDIPHELFAKVAGNTSMYLHVSFLQPGRYKLSIAMKDKNGARTGVWSRVLIVPQFSGESLATSSLVLTKAMNQSTHGERLSCNSRFSAKLRLVIGQPCSFAIGGTRFIPGVPAADGKPVVFRGDQQINVWMQAYNLGIDEKKHAPSAIIEYSVVNAATTATLSHKTESTDTMGPLADQITLSKHMSAAKLQPGAYQLQIKVHDNVSGQTVSESTLFAVE